jgi:1,4-dihydroxy-2-naphthoyl-CoA synthase
VTRAEFHDIRYEVDGPVAVVTIARPERDNAFRGQTVEELVHTDEGREGALAFTEKRKPDFARFAR